MSLPYEKKLIKNAKLLRKEATRHEKKLWYDFLCKYPIRFQRQKTINKYIVDFYCHKAKLVIELDGSQHYTSEREKYDTERTELLQTLGLDVLRFSNLDIDRNFKGVCEYIDMVIKEKGLV